MRARIIFKSGFASHDALVKWFDQELSWVPQRSIEASEGVTRKREIIESLPETKRITVDNSTNVVLLAQAGIWGLLTLSTTSAYELRLRDKNPDDLRRACETFVGVAVRSRKINFLDRVHILEQAEEHSIDVGVIRGREKVWAFLSDRRAETVSVLCLVLLWAMTAYAILPVDHPDVLRTFLPGFLPWQTVARPFIERVNSALFVATLTTVISMSVFFWERVLRRKSIVWLDKRYDES